MTRKQIGRTQQPMRVLVVPATTTIRVYLPVGLDLSVEEAVRAYLDGDLSSCQTTISDPTPIPSKAALIDE